MKAKADYDITADVGPLSTTPSSAIPMYSFDRPARILWNAIGRELTAKGWTEAQVTTWLQSKEPRWALDRELGAALEMVAQQYVNVLTQGERKMKAKAIAMTKTYVLPAMAGLAIVAALSFALHVSGIDHHDKALCHSHGGVTHCHAH